MKSVFCERGQGNLYVLTDGLWNKYYFSHWSGECPMEGTQYDSIDMNMYHSGPFTKDEMMKVIDSDMWLGDEKKKKIQEIISNS